MSRESIVHRLIAYFKKSDAPDHERRELVRHAIDTDPLREGRRLRPVPEPAQHAIEVAPYAPEETPTDEPLVRGARPSASHASRLDALVMRATQQFHARLGFVVRTDHDGRMRYCTGRTAHGRYVAHTDVLPSRRAIHLALDSGESQLVLARRDDPLAVAALCGPLWQDGQVIGLLYLDGPARSQLHRPIFDLFCEQAARLLRDGAA